MSNIDTNNDDNTDKTDYASSAPDFSGGVASPFEATQTGSFESGSDASAINDESDRDIDFAAPGLTDVTGETTFASAGTFEDFDAAASASTAYLEEEGDGDDIDDVVVIVEDTYLPVPYSGPASRSEGKSLAYHVGQLGGSVLVIVKENPVPAALTTLGLFSLVKGVRGGHKTDKDIVAMTRYGGLDDSYATGKSAAAKPKRPAATSLVEGVTNVASDAASSLVDIAKANPVPATAAALSLFWLVQSQRKGGDGLDKVASAAGKVADVAGRVGDKIEDLADATKNRAEELFDQTKETASGLVGTVSETASGLVGTVSETASGLVGSVSETASGAAQSVVGGATGAAHTVAEKATDAAHTVKEKATGAAKTVAQGATSAAHTAVETTTETAGTVARLLADNPLALALTALAIGVGLGFLLPETKAENNLMGDTADRISDAIADKARQAARDLTGKVEEVATGITDQVLSTPAPAPPENA